MTITGDSVSLFGTSGVRGVVGQRITPESCHLVGQALGTTLPERSRVCIATDTRLSREMVKGAVTSGLLSTGIDVTDCGVLPTPALALLTRELGFTAGVMVTASHNPPQFNGIKLFNGDSMGFGKAQEDEIERAYGSGEFRRGSRWMLEKGDGLKERYLQCMAPLFAGREMNRTVGLVVDPGNGAASGFASDVFLGMGLNAIPLHDVPDGLFPGRGPEPREDTVGGTVRFLRERGADLSASFDGDADRVVFCDREGFLGLDGMTAFISRLAVMETGRKCIATTVEAGMLLDLAVADLGVVVERGQVGDVSVAYLAREFDAAIGVEGVGVYILPQVGYYPDSMAATLFLLSHLGDVREIREFLGRMPALFSLKSKVPCPDECKAQAMAGLEKKAHLFGASRINSLDGLRLEFDGAWMLVRASGTEPAIRVIAESPSLYRTRQLVAQGVEAVGSCLEGVAV